MVHGFSNGVQHNVSNTHSTDMHYIFLTLLYFIWSLLFIFCIEFESHFTKQMMMHSSFYLLFFMTLWPSPVRKYNFLKCHVYWIRGSSEKIVYRPWRRSSISLAMGTLPDYLFRWKEMDIRYRSSTVCPCCILLIEVTPTILSTWERKEIRDMIKIHWYKSWKQCQSSRFLRILMKH